MKHCADFIQNFLLSKPSAWDMVALSVFIIFVTFQPFYLQHEIIMMETGIHLPAINALFHGLVPYKDFFFLRGPVELYVPAVMMKVGGLNSALLPLFYYAGTILTLLLCGVLAAQIFRSRLVFYAMTIVFVARTFPRISYYYWGGLRYAMGFLVLLSLFYFLKTQRQCWIFLAGVVCALSTLTTSEAGVSVFIAVLATFVFVWLFRILNKTDLWRAIAFYGLGLTFIFIPYFSYLWFTGSWQGFVESNYVVAMFNGKAYPGAPGIKPENPVEFLLALIPGHKFFKYLSALWCYIFFIGFLFYQAKHKTINWMHAFLTGVMFYGLVLYAAAFRKIEGHHFEMALQAQKFIYFFLIEYALFYGWDYFSSRSSGSGRRQWVYYAGLVMLLSSLIYSVSRFDHRFTMIKWIEKEVFHKKKVKGISLLENQDIATLRMERANGHVVPQWQKEEIQGVVEFLKANTISDEKVFCYPEVGNFNFWANRPFVGKFPIHTFTWMYEPWYQETLRDFKEAKPKYVVMTHLGHRTFPEVWYFRNPRNKEHFEEMTQLILTNYRMIRSFESVGIYERKKVL